MCLPKANQVSKNMDIPRAMPQEGERISKEDCETKIKRIIEEINNNYTLDKCLIIAGDSANIPKSLLELLEGTGINGFSCWNLDFKYCQYKSGQYDAYEFLCILDSLLCALICEFDSFMDFFLTGKNEGKENEHAWT